ncbi:helix-turn-helix domain-containing protein, partial [Roseisolibacter sp. H3M3-2]|uniref:helix-turn-helix domain-containing protein n=1 Tax=Roseisolibacter sp. H3M3-2 TaxID=3031323 RepID=UPI0023DC7527
LARRLVARGRARAGHDAAVSRVRSALTLLDRAAEPAGDRPGDVESHGAARVAAIARVLAVSQRTLERLFAEHVGFAPRTYQRTRRVGAVAEALEQEAWARQALARDTDGRDPLSRAVPDDVRDDASRPVRYARPGERRAPRAATLSELAHRVGYTDHAHMTREFTRVMGTAPSVYRRDAHAAPLVRRFGPVAFERTIPWGTMGRGAQVAPEASGIDPASP